MLHIVNGDCAIQALKDSGIEGDFLSWLDVLHDGPVPEGLSLEELSEVRAEFIADCDWAVLEKAKNAFQKRDIVFRKCHEYDEVVLWNSFELFDQLHIMQLLDGFAQARDNFQHLSVIFLMTIWGVDPLNLCRSGLKRENWFQKNNSFLDNLAGKLLPPKHLN